MQSRIIKTLLSVFVFFAMYLPHSENAEAQFVPPPLIIFPFPYVDLITLDPITPFGYKFSSIDPLLYSNTGFNLKSLGIEPLSLDVVSGFDPDLGINLLDHTIQERFVLIDGTLGLKLTNLDPNGGRYNVRINYTLDVGRTSLRARQIEGRIRARQDSGAAQWVRADWLRDVPRRDARMIDARMLRRDARTGRWALAVDAIRHPGTTKQWMGDSEPDGVLGHHGYNSEDGYVWAVLDVNSEYAAGVNFDHDADDILNVEDNCPIEPNTNQANADEADDGGDACDADDDNDGVDDVADNCPLVANADQLDYDLDGVGFACETDDDGDGVFGGLDLCPATASGTVGADGCSVADLCPCENGWKNHGKYVKCITQTAKSFVEANVIGEIDKAVLVSAAAQSSCGVKAN